MSSGSPSQIVHDVGGPIRGSPSSRHTGTPEQLSLEVVECRIERSLRGLLAWDLRRAGLPTSSSANGSSPSSARMLLDERERRLGSLVVAVDRRRLASTDVLAVPQLDLDDVLPVARLAGDHEGLRQLEADDAGVDVHTLTLSRPVSH